MRAALLDAAATLFSARGPASVSVRDIAAHAGVNHGLVHRHFGSKQALVAGVLERGAREIAAMVAGAEWKAGALAGVREAIDLHCVERRDLVRGAVHFRFPAVMRAATRARSSGVSTPGPGASRASATPT